MQEWKASEKEAQKMTRDGAISLNLVTGEATHISDRPQEQDYSSADETAGTLSRAVDEVEGHVEWRQAKKARRKRRDTFREGEAARDRPSSRLQFSEADRAAPELKKAVRKSDKAADKLDAAKAAVPVKPPGKEHGNPLSRPVQEVKSTLHSEVSKVEGENSGVQAGHLGERQIEKAVGYGGRRFHQARADRKLKPWRDVSKAEQAAVKANADFYWQKSVMENPQLASSNPISRLWQKKRLQKQYAAAHRAGTGAAQAAGKASQTAASAAKKGGGTIAPYWELARSQSQMATSSTPPLISLPMQMPCPNSLRQSKTRICRAGRPMTLPSGFLPDLMATESSWVRKVQPNSTHPSLESGSHPSPFQIPSDWNRQWLVTMSRL